MKAKGAFIRTKGLEQVISTLLSQGQRVANSTKKLKKYLLSQGQRVVNSTKNLQKTLYLRAA